MYVWSCTFLRYAQSLFWPTQFFHPYVWGWKVVYLVNLIWNNDTWGPKMNLSMLEEEIKNDLYCDYFLARHYNGHIRELFNIHKYIVVTFLGWRKSIHVVLGGRLSSFVWGGYRNVQPLLLDGRFPNDTCCAGYNISNDILLDFGPTKILLQYFHFFSY